MLVILAGDVPKPPHAEDSGECDTFKGNPNERAFQALPILGIL
jgi:hypothetical protein